jgi:hypothetical protein
MSREQTTGRTIVRSLRMTRTADFCRDENNVFGFAGQLSIVCARLYGQQMVT